MRNLILAIMAVFGLTASARVFDGAIAWYRGALDRDGNMSIGTSANQEFPDALHEGGSTSYFTQKFVASTSAAGNLPICEEEVVHPYSGKSMGVRQCLRFDQPIDVNGNVKPQLMILNQVASYFPTNSVGWTVFMRFKQQIGVQYDSAKESDVQTLLNFYGYSSPGGSGLFLKTNGNPTNGYVSVKFGNSEYASMKNTMVNNADYCLKTNVWTDVVVSLCGTQADVYFVREGGLIGHVAVTHSTEQDFSKSGSQIRIGGYQAKSTAVALTAPEAQLFRGLVHDFAFWGRKLTEAEVYEVLQYSGSDLVNLGVVNGSSQEFIGSGSAVVECATSNDWRAASPTIAAGQTLTVRFSMTEREAGLGELLRVAATESSSSALLGVAVNSASVGSLAVNPGGIARLFVPQGAFVAGENTLVLTAPAALAEPVCLDALALGGSWQLADDDDSTSGTAGNGGRADFYVGSNTAEKYLKTQVNTGDGISSVYVNLHCRFPEDLYDGSRFVQFRAKASCGAGSRWESIKTNQTIEVKVNGVNYGQSVLPLAGWNELKFKIPVAAFCTGDNVIELNNITPKDWCEPGSNAYMYTRFSFYRLEMLGDPSGLILLLR